MIPRIAAGGGSFKHAMQYYMHDKNASTRRRVEWTHTENVLTDDPDKASRVMCYTAKEHERLKEASGQARGGRKLTKPVFSFSLSWHPEQKPDRAHMLATARGSLQVLGFADHETVIIAHRDEPHRHIHIIVNRVHPVTGIAARTSNSKLKLSAFARDYERQDGKIYCKQREDNHRRRAKGEKTMYREPVIAEAYARSDTGSAFVQALAAKGYQLAQGRSRLVVIDPYGQTHNPVRHIEGLRTSQFTEKLRDVELTALPDATHLSKAVMAKNRQRYDESLRHDEASASKRKQREDRQREECAEMGRAAAARTERERETLERAHRIAEQQAEIARLRERTQNSKWWQRWLGLTQHAQQLLEQREATHANAQWRIRERVEQMEAEKQRTLARMAERHAQETRQAEQAAEHARPKDYAVQTEREKMRKAFDAEWPAPTRTGPELER
ncbi:MAG: relaxase/mobilization nuclease domain-containing protein [Opitutaceae bacterium]